MKKTCAGSQKKKGEQNKQMLCLLFSFPLASLNLLNNWIAEAEASVILTSAVCVYSAFRLRLGCGHRRLSVWLSLPSSTSCSLSLAAVPSSASWGSSLKNDKQNREICSTWAEAQLWMIALWCGGCSAVPPLFPLPHDQWSSLYPLHTKDYKFPTVSWWKENRMAILPLLCLIR